MKKAMLSQPMTGKTEEEIVATREKTISVLEEKDMKLLILFSQTSGIAKMQWQNGELFKSRFVFS